MSAGFLLFFSREHAAWSFICCRTAGWVVPAVTVPPQVALESEPVIVLQQSLLLLLLSFWPQPCVVLCHMEDGLMQQAQRSLLVSQ